MYASTYMYCIAASLIYVMYSSAMLDRMQTQWMNNKLNHISARQKIQNSPTVWNSAPKSLSDVQM